MRERSVSLAARIDLPRVARICETSTRSFIYFVRPYLPSRSINIISDDFVFRSAARNVLSMASENDARSGYFPEYEGV